MRNLRWLMLAGCFFIDVRVRAEVFVAPKTPKLYVHGGQRITLDAAGLIELRGGQPHLVRGSMLLEAEAKATLAVPFASFRCAKACRALARREADHVTFMNLAGNWEYRRVGDAQDYALAAGLQVRLGEVTPGGVAEAEFPQGLPWDGTVALWAHLFRGETKVFKEQVAEFRPTWRDAVERLSDQHADVARSEIARHLASVNAQARAKASEDAESAELRALFRRKNGFED